METPWDWITVAIFAGLVVLFLQRSSGEHEPNDSIWQYLFAAVGCAVANYLGNHDQPILAGIVVAGTLAYTWFVLRPLDRMGGGE